MEGAEHKEDVDDDTTRQNSNNDTGEKDDNEGVENNKEDGNDTTMKNSNNDIWERKVMIVSIN